METRDQSNWSIGLGRWASARVEVHLFFAAFIALTFCWAWFGPAGQPDSPLANVGIACVALVVLLSSLFIHELGHFVACHLVRGHVGSVTLMPWGGVDSVYLPSAHSRLLFYVGGPIANLLVALTCMLVMQIAFEETITSQLFDPSGLGVFMATSLDLLTLKLLFWVNWLLFLVNMLPGIPFDGGHIVPALIQSFRPNWESRRIVRVSCIVTYVSASVLVAGALIGGTRSSDQFIPISLLLVPLAITLFFSARLYGSDPEPDSLLDWEDDDLDTADSDFLSLYEDDYFEGDEDENSISDWLHARQLERERHAQMLEVEEEKKADEILAKLHENGIDSLTEEDRELLQRVSARIRKRSREQA